MEGKWEAFALALPYMRVTGETPALRQWYIDPGLPSRNVILSEELL